MRQVTGREVAGCKNKRTLMALYRPTYLRYRTLKIGFFYHVITDISVVLRETCLTISDSIETGPPIETDIVRVVSLSTTETSEITRFKNRSSGLDTLTNYMFIQVIGTERH